jgi:hypothetical protein
MRISRSRSALACVAVVCCACADDPLSKLHPQIEVDPPQLDFGAGIVNQQNVLNLTVKDVGSGPLTVMGVSFDPTTSVFSAGDVPKSVLPSLSAPLPIIFVPLKAHEVYDGAVTIRSNDPKNPMVRVPLHGVGGVRHIDVEPKSIDFGVVNEGTSPRRAIQISNTGGDPLVITAVTWTSTSVDLTLVQSGLVRSGGMVLPKTSTAVEVQYAPVDLGGDQGVVTIVSNDEMTPMVTVPVKGMANLAPHAIAWGCDMPLVPHQAGCDDAMLEHVVHWSYLKLVGLDGRQSVDPEGQPIASYRWKLITEPMNSHALIFASSEDITLRNRATSSIQVDEIGNYDVRLIVQDVHGLDSFDLPESHVMVLPHDLDIRLRWDVDVDIDLHVVEPGGHVGDYGNGMALTSTGSDCCAFNRDPNWGNLMSHADDPSLDMDVVNGSQPETVSLDFPQDGGTYKVYAHYCSSRTHVPANVILEVYVRGTLARRVPMLDPGYAIREGELWHAADVTWMAATPSAMVTDGSTTTPMLDPALCMIH